MESINTKLLPGETVLNKEKKSKKKEFFRRIYKSRQLYIILIPVLLYYIVFQYLPLYGSLMAFEDFSPKKGILGSPWVGLKYFNQFFHSIYFFRLLRNTVIINLYGILVGFTIPILLALFINELSGNVLKRYVQTILYMPHFVSTVVLVGLVSVFLSPRDGLINFVLQTFGMKTISFMTQPKWFRSIYVWSGVWQNSGWESIIYLAALASIDIALYESAMIDGATRWKRLIYITVPCILPTIIIMFILRVGSIFTIGFEKIMLMYNPLTYGVGDVISTYVYRQGLLEGDFSFSTAVGIFNSVLNMTILLCFNAFSKKVNKVSLW